MGGYVGTSQDSKNGRGARAVLATGPVADGPYPRRRRDQKDGDRESEGCDRYRDLWSVDPNPES